MAFRYYNLFSDWTSKWNGWRDAAKKIPAQDDQPVRVTNESWSGSSLGLAHDTIECATPFEARICNRANLLIRKIYENWQTKDALLAGEQADAERRYEQALENYENQKKLRGRDAWFDRVPRWYLPLIIVFGIAEFYMNSQVFLVFGGSVVETWLMAIVLSFAIPLAGHFWGLFLRERPWNKTLLGWATAALFVVGITIWYLSRVRAAFVEESGAVITSVDFGRYTWLFFLSLNLLIFVIAVAAAYHAHEEDPRLLKYKQDFQKANRRLRSLQAERNSLKATQENTADAVAHRGQELIELYRQSNRRKRKDGTPPLFQTTQPDIKTPPFVPQEYAELQIMPRVVPDASKESHITTA
jgi:hypothetical protein